MKPLRGLVVALLLGACSRPVAFDPSVLTVLEPREAEAALPPGYALGPGGLVVSLAWVSSLEQSGPQEERGGEACYVDTSLRRLLFPETDFYSPSQDGRELPVTAFTRERRPAEGRRFLPYRGRYPGQVDYEAYERAVIAVRPDSPEARAVGEALALALASRAGAEGQASGHEANDIVWVVAAGDLLLSRGIGASLLRPGGQEAVFGGALPVMRSADLCLVNLEGAVSLGGRKASKTYTFRFDPATIPALAAAGVDYASVANNHSFDYGPEAFLDTLEHLSRAGIATSGAGAHLEAALKPASFLAGPSAYPVDVFALAAYPRERSGFDGRAETKASADTPGVLWDDEATVEALARSMRPGRVAIVMVHGGEEWTDRPSPGQLALYRRLVDGGADLVVGSHPHVLQGHERYRDGVIFYSLGNFVFPGMEDMPGAQESALARVGFLDACPAYIELLPLRLDQAGVDLDPRPAERLERLARLGRSLMGR